ncbi:type VI secretion system-associated protein VasI [Burkholderia contaminans]|uniref:type VI secretion system-associated protein VasI n=1 Tax=Burkholderia contaminans TaxID=488447 RepID=UPI001CF1DB72|nr:type VI secretion system-associated protein VasI [Burkholderia contaminans]MCA8102825.1 type VI secretion system-associated protein TagO [Burkholderia contaminans]
MRSLSMALVCAALVAGCDAAKQGTAAGPSEAAPAATKACTAIVSAVERLACFDALVGTPPAPAPVAAIPATQSNAASAAADDQKPPAPPAIVERVRLNEAERGMGETEFRLSRTEEAIPGRWSVVMSAPALGGATAPPILAISCLSNISRLQLLAHQPVAPNRMNIRLLLDGKPISASVPWQVLEDGTVVDAGRGLVAIEQLRYLVKAGGRLQVESDYAPFSELLFDASNLHDLMKQQREACHW